MHRLLYPKPANLLDKSVHVIAGSAFWRPQDDQVSNRVVKPSSRLFFFSGRVAFCRAVENRKRKRPPALETSHDDIQPIAIGNLVAIELSNTQIAFCVDGDSKKQVNPSEDV